VLDRFMVTPRHHRVHHGANPEYIDKNFGGTFLLWDKLFGTFQRALPTVPIQYGTPGLQQTHDPFWANHLPLLRYLRLKEPRVRTQPVSSAQVRCVASGGVLIFAVVVFYVAHEGALIGPQQAWLFALLVASTLALGALSDGRWGGQLAWLALGVGAPLSLIGWLGLREPLGCGLLGLLGVHALGSTGWWMWARWRRVAPREGRGALPG